MPDHPSVECPWCRNTGRQIILIPPDGMTGKEYLELPPPRPDPKLKTGPCHVCKGTCLCTIEEAIEFLDLQESIENSDGPETTEIDYASMIHAIEQGEDREELNAIVDGFKGEEGEKVPGVAKDREIPEGG